MEALGRHDFGNVAVLSRTLAPAAVLSNLLQERGARVRLGDCGRSGGFELWGVERKKIYSQKVIGEGRTKKDERER